MDINDALGVTGGSWGFLTFIFGLFLVSFAKMNYLSLIANRFYTWNAPQSFQQNDSLFHSYFANQVDYLTENDQKKKFEIPRPHFLSVWQFVYQYICCLCKGARYRDYKETIKIVEQDMRRNLDILDLLRRLKMHGCALSS